MHCRLHKQSAPVGISGRNSKPCLVPTAMLCVSPRSVFSGAHTLDASISSNSLRPQAQQRQQRSVTARINPQDTIWVTGGSALSLVVATLVATGFGTVLLGRAVAQMGDGEMDGEVAEASQSNGLNTPGEPGAAGSGRRARLTAAEVQELMDKQPAAPGSGAGASAAEQ